MELYEILYKVPAAEVEPSDLIRFSFEDVDGNAYDEIVQVDNVDYDGDYVFISGFSEVLNDRDEYHLLDEVMVEVLGG